MVQADDETPLASGFIVDKFVPLLGKENSGKNKCESVCVKGGEQKKIILVHLNVIP